VLGHNIFLVENPLELLLLKQQQLAQIIKYLFSSHLILQGWIKDYRRCEIDESGSSRYSSKRKAVSPNMSRAIKLWYNENHK